MAKRQVRLQSEGTRSQEITLSSGVKIKVIPFPTGLYWDLMDKLHQEFPDPNPPKKTIKVVDGTEDVDNFDDPEYKRQVQKAEAQRSSEFALAVMDLCVEILVDKSEIESQIKRMLKYTDKEPPEDEFERKVFYLEKWAFRSRTDYENTLLTATEQTVIEDPEVAERIRSFQSQVEGAKPSNNDASSPNEV